MSTPPSTYREVPKAIEDQLALYFDNQATPEVVQAIQDWLQADPANARAFAEYGTIERMIYNAQKTEDASAIFALLQEAEDNAKAELVALDPKRLVLPDTQWMTKDDTVTIKKAFSVLGYAGLQTARRHVVAITGIAAVLGLAVVLGVVLISNNQDNTEPAIAEQTDDDAPTPVAPSPIVATLTAEHDAVWDQKPGGDHRPGDLRPGTQLAAGQRLSLTAGFAEITTNDGAIAILEAPATVELLDNDNALRLHSGKLVGICKTESSKGFLVRTPHMDVTDLGTRFGVKSSRKHNTEVHVFEGEVEVALRDRSSGSDVITRRMSAGQALRSSPIAPRLVAIEPKREDFQHAVRPVLSNALPITGRGIGVGATDSNWRVVAVDGQPLVGEGAMVALGLPDLELLADSPVTGQWLWIDQSLVAQTPRGGSAIYTCRNTFVIGKDIEAIPSRVLMSCAGDHSVKAIRLNGHDLNVPPNRRQGASTKPFAINLGPYLRRGANTIEIDLIDIAAKDQNRAGLYLSTLTLTDTGDLN